MMCITLINHKSGIKSWTEITIVDFSLIQTNIY